MKINDKMSHNHSLHEATVLDEFRCHFPYSGIECDEAIYDHFGVKFPLLVHVTGVSFLLVSLAFGMLTLEHAITRAKRKKRQVVWQKDHKFLACLSFSISGLFGFVCYSVGRGFFSLTKPQLYFAEYGFPLASAFFHIGFFDVLLLFLKVQSIGIKRFEVASKILKAGSGVCFVVGEIVAGILRFDDLGFLRTFFASCCFNYAIITGVLYYQRPRLQFDARKRRKSVEKLSVTSLNSKGVDAHVLLRRKLNSFLNGGIILGTFNTLACGVVSFSPIFEISSLIPAFFSLIFAASMVSLLTTFFFVLKKGKLKTIPSSTMASLKMMGVRHRSRKSSRISSRIGSSSAMRGSDSIVSRFASGVRTSDVQCT